MSDEDRQFASGVIAKTGAAMIVGSLGACVSGYGTAGLWLLVLGFIVAVVGWMGSR